MAIVPSNLYLSSWPVPRHIKGHEFEIYWTHLLWSKTKSEKQTLYVGNIHHQYSMHTLAVSSTRAWCGEGEIWFCHVWGKVHSQCLASLLPEVHKWVSPTMSSVYHAFGCPTSTKAWILREAFCWSSRKLIILRSQKWSNYVCDVFVIMFSQMHWVTNMNRSVNIFVVQGSTLETTLIYRETIAILLDIRGTI